MKFQVHLVLAGLVALLSTQSQARTNVVSGGGNLQTYICQYQPGAPVGAAYAIQCKYHIVAPQNSIEACSLVSKAFTPSAEPVIHALTQLAQTVEVAEFASNQVHVVIDKLRNSAQLRLGTSPTLICLPKAETF